MALEAEYFSVQPKSSLLGTFVCLLTKDQHLFAEEIFFLAATTPVKLEWNVRGKEVTLYMYMNAKQRLKKETMT